MRQKFILIGLLAVLAALVVGAATAFAAGPGGHKGAKGKAAIEAAAKELGMEPKDLAGELFEGKTLAQVGEVQGVAAEDLVTALTAGPQERLAQALSDGTITQEQHDSKLARIQEKVERVVGSEWSMKPNVGRGRHGKGKIHGPGHLIKRSAEQIGIEAPALIEELRADNTIAQVAETNGVSVSLLVEALIQPMRDEANEAIANGRITADEAAERLQNAEEKITEALNRTWPEDLGQRNQGRGRHQGNRGPGRILNGAAELLGMPMPELVEGLRSGKSVAEIAAEQGVAFDIIVDAIVAKVRDKVDEAVANGRITPEEALERIEQITNKITEMLSNPLPLRARDGAPVPSGANGQVNPPSNGTGVLF